MSEQVCANILGSQVCIRDVLHPGACRSKSEHYWAKGDSGRDDIKPYAPIGSGTYKDSDMREVSA